MGEQLFFTIKTKDEDTVNAILTRNENIEIDGLNVLKEMITAGQRIFIVFGGDKPLWETGLIGIGIITKPPYDTGYDKNNYKVQITPKVLLNHPITREDLIPYRDTYGTIGISPIVKWEPNQALSRVPEKNAIALMRAMLELDESVESQLNMLIDADMMKRVKGVTNIMVEIPTEYGEEIETAVSDKYMNSHNKDKSINYCTNMKWNFQLNRIVFGAPGTGKSYELEQDRKKILNDGSIGDFERVTFHPEYSYSQFVGTYKPVTDELGEIRYQFVPGPFMRIYSEALENARTDDPQPFVLLIEEINRAKVAAVFGEVFQLLDRADDGSSMYEIEASEDIRKYLAGKLGGAPDNYRRIKLPDNMFIWATMNSADQGVFPMDTAFKRRWNFEYLSINANEDKVVSTVDLVKDRPESNVNWNRFRKAINTKLTSEYKVNEDKLLGPFFLSGNLIAPVSDTDSSMAYPDEFRDAFRNKVIMYLYEDAARQNRHKLFSGCDSAMYSSVCEAFDRTGMEIFGENFRTDYYDQQKE